MGDQQITSGADVEADLIYGIGAVAVAASRMEMIAAGVFANLLGGGKVAELVAHGQNWASVLQSCRAILSGLEASPEGTRMRSVFDRAESAYAQRSRIVHGFWVAAVGDGGERFSVLPKRYGRREVNGWTIEQLDEVRRELSAIGTEMLAAGQGLFSVTATSIR